MSKFKMRFLVAASAFVLGVSNSKAEMSFKEYYESRHKIESFAYLAGVSSALGWLNGYVKLKTGSYVYCEKENALPNVDAYAELVINNVRTNRELMDKDLSLAVLDSLLKKFPCQ